MHIAQRVVATIAIEDIGTAAAFKNVIGPDRSEEEIIIGRSAEGLDSGKAVFGRMSRRHPVELVDAGNLKMEQEPAPAGRSEEHTSELQSLMRISYAVFCLKKKKNHT